MMLGVPVAITFFGSAVRGSSTSSSMWSPGSVALQLVPPSAERKRCHAPRGTTAILPARTTKDLGGPVVADNVQGLRAVENVNQLVLGMIFPMTRACGLAGNEDTVTVGPQ